jgi:hypothetical protein
VPAVTIGDVGRLTPATIGCVTPAAISIDTAARQYVRDPGAGSDDPNVLLADGLRIDTGYRRAVTGRCLADPADPLRGHRLKMAMTDPAKIAAISGRAGRVRATRAMRG